MIIKAGNLDYHYMENVLLTKKLNPNRYAIHYESKNYPIRSGEIFCAFSSFYIVATLKQEADK